MHDTDYAFGVAKIRYNELTLLNRQETEQLVAADSVGSVLRLLADKGWDVPDEGGDSSKMLESEAQKAWQLMIEAAPDINVLNALILPEDFQNLKAVLKCLVANEKPDALFTEPSVTSPGLIEEAVKEKKFDTLPEHLREAAKEGYEAAALSHGAGRMIDIVVDKYALEERIKAAVKSKVRVLEQIARLACAAADIKIALRGAAVGKDEEFMARAMAESGLVDNSRLIEAALKGRAEIALYLEKTTLAGVAEAVKEGNTAFEKWCDDAVAGITEGERGTAFGVGPLAAYYMAKTTEIKNVRIILSAKRNNLPEDAIRERVRRAYV